MGICLRWELGESRVMGMSEEKRRALMEQISFDRSKIQEISLSIAAISFSLNIVAVHIESIGKAIEEEETNDPGRGRIEGEEDFGQDGYRGQSLN